MFRAHQAIVNKFNKLIAVARLQIEVYAGASVKLEDLMYSESLTPFIALLRAETAAALAFSMWFVRQREAMSEGMRTDGQEVYEILQCGLRALGLPETLPNFVPLVQADDYHAVFRTMTLAELAAMDQMEIDKHLFGALNGGSIESLRNLRNFPDYFRVFGFHQTQPQSCVAEA